MATAAASPIVYTAKICPYAQRALIALDEAGVKHERYEIDLKNKPTWYNDRVNPASKVPVLVLNPSDKSENGGGEDKNGTEKIPESLVISEYIAEQYPQTNLLAKDALQRAKQRYAIERFSSLYSPAWMSLIREHDVAARDGIFKALEEFQGFLPAESEGPFFGGKQFTLVDLATSPFIGRLLTLSKAGLVPGDAEKGPIHKEVLESARFTRLAKWWEAILARPSWQSTFEPEVVVEHYRKSYLK